MRLLTAGSLVRVQLEEPHRSKLCIACSDFFTKIRARLCRCSSFCKKSRSAHLLGWKRSCNGLLSLSTFCGFKSTSKFCGSVFSLPLDKKSTNDIIDAFYFICTCTRHFLKSKTLCLLIAKCNYAVFARDFRKVPILFLRGEFL